MVLNILKIRRQFHFKKLDSTSSFLKRNYRKLNNLTFVSADYQTDGHGRMGRSWESTTKKNLMFSFLIKDKEIINKFDSLSLSIGVSIYKTLTEYNLSNVSLKWPNDVYCNSKKISGILLESISSSNNIDCIVAGIGVNLNQETYNVLTATSYYLETNKTININKFKKSLYKNIKEMISDLKNNDNSYLDIFREHDFLKNKEVYADINNKKELVKVLGINDDNTIKVELNNTILNLRSGEISFHKDSY